MARSLVVIYGAPFSGKSSVAGALARSLPGQSALLSTDALLTEAIAVHATRIVSELDLVQLQVRMLVASYLKTGYSVVVEGSFLYERAGAWHDRQVEVDQLQALMRNLVESALNVRLTASDAVLAARARSAGREGELAAAQRLNAAYRERSAAGWLTLDTTSTAPEAVAAAIGRELGVARVL